MESQQRLCLMQKERREETVDTNGRVQRLNIFCNQCEKEQFDQRNVQTARALLQTFALISAISVPIMPHNPTSKTQTAQRAEELNPHFIVSEAKPTVPLVAVVSLDSFAF